jgi:hypothetical protein
MQHFGRKLPEFELKFRLDVDDGWPPVGAEILPVDRQNDLNSILAPPFFVKGISVGDVLRCSLDFEGYVKYWEHVEISSRSTVWVHYKSPIRWELAKKQLLERGCNVETLLSYKCVSVDVPQDLLMARIDEIMVPVIEAGGFFVVPSMRHCID